MALSHNRIHVCPVETGLELLSGKWKPRILWKLHQQGVLRFGEFRRQMPDITAKMLTQQLRDLEKDGLIDRKVYPEVPPKVEYSLSAFGETLKPILDMIAQWGTVNHHHIVTVLEETEAA
ncbi:MAG: helix-turn-helix transcriptional regulator [Anaerolineae bacterium]|nr:helix-turn-helix transcriptional regulator [Anaerolineae bacterium]